MAFMSNVLLSAIELAQAAGVDLDKLNIVPLDAILGEVWTITNQQYGVDKPTLGWEGFSSLLYLGLTTCLNKIVEHATTAGVKALIIKQLKEAATKVSASLETFKRVNTAVKGTGRLAQLYQWTPYESFVALVGSGRTTAVFGETCDPANARTCRTGLACTDVHARGIVASRICSHSSDGSLPAPTPTSRPKTTAPPSP